MGIEDSLKAKQALALAAAITPGGVLPNGVWIKLPSPLRLWIGGFGTIRIDTRTRSGTITVGAENYVAAGDRDIPEYPYFGDAYEVRAMLTGSATVEIIA